VSRLNKTFDMIDEKKSSWKTFRVHQGHSSFTFLTSSLFPSNTFSSLFKQEIEYFRQHDSLDGKVRIQLGGTGAAADESIERGEEKDGKSSSSHAPKVTTHSLRGIHRRS
jgi:hypothetical protein